MTARTPFFDKNFQKKLDHLFIMRRDVRHFKPTSLPSDTIENLIEIANLSPSVGLSQPWRFVIVNTPERREQIRQCFEAENAHALAQQKSSERAVQYAHLKLAGLDTAPVQFAVFTDTGTAQGNGLGRATMPEMLAYSTVTAIHTLWLAARAQGLGLGWVSILDPQKVQSILGIADRTEWQFMGYFCLGYPKDISDIPELERSGWENRRSPETFISYC